MVGQSFETESNLYGFLHGSVVQPHDHRTESYRESNLSRFHHGRTESFQPSDHTIVEGQSPLESSPSRFHHGRTVLSMFQPHHHRRTDNLQVWSSAMAGQSPSDVVEPKFEHGRTVL